MRLKDVDKLVVDARLGEDEIPYVSKAQIDEAPTVEAIPIEWLKKRFMDRDNSKWCYDWHVIADCLIEEWEKENG